jgi:hypothetical protein
VAFTLPAAGFRNTGYAEPYRYDERADFTGGLNLRADQFNLAPSESPALLNVDVDPRGGVSRRNAIDALNGTALADQIYGIYQHSDASVNQILASVKDSGNSKLYWNNGASGNFGGTAVASAAGTVVFAGVQPPASVTFNEYTYLSNGSLLSSEGTKSAVRWSGSNNATTLTPDIDASDGHFPAARYLATWGQFVWVAYTTESGTAYKNRVRFSEVNDAENWTATDFIDIDIGEDGDFITAIIPDADRLLVFKQNSVYAIYGFSRDSFEVRNITRAAGCRNGTSPIASTVGIFFWYAEDGVYLLSYDDLAWAFERLKPALDDGSTLTLGTAPSMMWFDEKLWLSVDYQSGDNLAGSDQANRRNTFMWDPSLGQSGAWARYDINARSLLAYRPTGAAHLGLAVTSVVDATAAFTRVSKVDVDEDVDDYDGTTGTEIQSFYQTGWFIGNRPTFTKRWGKTRTVMLADNTLTVRMGIYKDYDLSTEAVSQSQSIVGVTTTALWDTAKWDVDEWAAGGTSNIYKFFRWPTAGTAKAISLRFSVSPAIGNRGTWGLTSAVAMYRTRRIR